MNALPSSLDRFQSQLEVAIGRATRTQRRRRLAYRLATLGATAVAVVVVVGVAGVVTERGPSVVDRAAAALTAAPDTILHIRIYGERTEADGSVVAWENESWRETSEPFLQRHATTQTDGRRVEWSFDGQLHLVYSAEENTIYELSKVQLGKAIVELAAPGKPAPSASAAGNEHGAQHGTAHATTAGTSVEDFREDILALLDSGAARADGRVVVDGRDAIRIVSTESRVTYLVDATTYDPIEWRTEEVGGSTTTLRFLAYEELTPTNATRTLVDIRAQHPTATVSNDARAAEAALGLAEG